jgi:hypothetical protein
VVTPGRRGRAYAEEELRQKGIVGFVVSKLHRDAYIRGIALQRRLRSLPDSEIDIYRARRRYARASLRKTTDLVATALRAGLVGLTGSLTLLPAMAGRRSPLPVRRLVKLRQRIHARWVGRLKRSGVPYAFIHWVAEPLPDGLPHFHLTALLRPEDAGAAWEALRLSVFPQRPGKSLRLPSSTVLTTSELLTAKHVEEGRRGGIQIRWVGYVQKAVAWEPAVLAERGKPDLLTMQAWAWAHGVTPAATRLPDSSTRARIKALVDPPAEQGPLEALGVQAPPCGDAADAPTGLCYPCGADDQAEPGAPTFPSRNPGMAFLRRYAALLAAELSATKLPGRDSIRLDPQLAGAHRIADANAPSLRRRVAALETLLRRRRGGERALVALRRKASTGAP